MFLWLNCWRRSDSFWAPYIEILPREYNIPFYWSPEELEELKVPTSWVVGVWLDMCRVLGYLRML